jgi:hypothetical protein
MAVCVRHTVERPMAPRTSPTSAANAQSMAVVGGQTVERPMAPRTSPTSAANVHSMAVVGGHTVEPPMATDTYLSKQKAARRLDVSAKTIDRLRAAGELDAMKLTDAPTSRVRVTVASLEAYEARRHGKLHSAAEDLFPIPALEAIRAEKAARRCAAAAGEEAAA